jgi:hypothetical protein
MVGRQEQVARAVDDTGRSEGRSHVHRGLSREGRGSDCDVERRWKGMHVMLSDPIVYIGTNC